MAIISDCIHTRKPNGTVGTANHVFLKQMEALSKAFSEVVLCCPFIPFGDNMVVSTYKQPHIDFIELPNAGGDKLRDKWRLLKTLPVWWRAFKKVAERADVVYQRFPNNLNIPGFFFFYFKKAKVFATYTGTWKNYKGEPATYRMQKWLLRKYFRGPVFAYLEEQRKERHLIKSFSPSFTLKEWDDAASIVAAKIERFQKGDAKVPTFITVGSLVPQKNQQYILDTFKRLHERNIDFVLYLAGDGILKKAYAAFIDLHGLGNKVFLTGHIDQQALQEYYKQADFLIQATLVEGYGKAPMEGFSYGVVPILNNITLAKEMTGTEERGFLFDANEECDLETIVLNALEKNSSLQKMIIEGRRYSVLFTLESWAADILKTMRLF